MVGGDLRESLDAIGQGLHRLVRESSSKAELTKSLNTLVMLLQNLLNNPASERHRKINASGGRFRELLGNAGSAGAELLRLAGFEYAEPNFTLPAEHSTDSAQHVLDMLQDSQRSVEQAWASRREAPGEAPRVPAGEAASPPAAQPGAGASGAFVVEAASSSAAPLGAGSGAGGAMQPGGGGGGDAGTGSAGSAHSSTEPTAAGPGSGGWQPQGPRAPAVARPWESAGARPGAVGGGGLPWQLAPPRTPRQEPALASDGGTGGDGSNASSAAPPQQLLAQGLPMAHPAESQEWGPGPPIAHPAEAEASPQMMPLPVLQAQHSPQPSVSQMPIAHPAEALEAETRSSGGSGASPAASVVAVAAPLPFAMAPAAAMMPAAVVTATAVAHPAEGGLASEEPQSGG